MAANNDEKRSRAIELLAQGTMSYTQIAEDINVNVLTLRRWRAEPEFASDVVNRAQQLIKDELPSIFNVLIENAKAGSHQHIKMVLDYLHKLEELKHTADKGAVTFTWKQ